MISVTKHLLSVPFVILRIVSETIFLIDSFLGGGRTSFCRMSIEQGHLGDQKHPSDAETNEGGL